jgi:hypothetical protein
VCCRNCFSCVTKLIPQFYFEVSDLCSVLAWCRPGDFLLLMAFGPLVEKLAAMAAATKAIKWIQKEQQALFI